jgi:hypothetical protein
MARVYFNWPNRKIRIHSPNCPEVQDLQQTDTGLCVEYPNMTIAFQIANAYATTYKFTDVPAVRNAHRFAETPLTARGRRAAGSDSDMEKLLEAIERLDKVHRAQAGILAA